MKKPITIKDIARQLGISPSTVSRALKDNPEISVETRKKVSDLAKELNYEPNILALNLRQSKTNTIGVILPELVHFFFSTVVSGIEDVAYSKGYNVIICQSNESAEREKSDTKALYNHRVDGILACISKESNDLSHFIAVQDKGIPVVFFDRKVDIDASSVLVDDFKGSYDATMHLISSGRKNIVHLAGPENLHLTNNRIDGFKKAHEDSGLSLNTSNIITCGTGTAEEATALVTELLKSESEIDGIFAVNDLAAFGAMKAVKDANKSVPEDLAIVGFSNWQFSSFTNPPLTTVDQPGYEMGKKAAEMLLSEIEMKENEFIEPHKVILNTHLIKRESA
ncbi:MAG: LacI family DNA-binding transcriptional regulator [Cyclobacteriaceae bacterium]